jgi:hypothetical protein
MQEDHDFKVSPDKVRETISRNKKKKEKGSGALLK